jgi:hypothetical protein
MLTPVGVAKTPVIREGLSLPQIKALELLFTGQRIVDIAAEVGVDRTTIYDWLNNNANFRAAYRFLKAEQFDNLARRLLALGDKAVDAYATVLEGPAIPGAFTLSKTADSIINQIFKLKELMDIDERLAEIEARLAEVERDEF